MHLGSVRIEREEKSTAPGGIRVYVLKVMLIEVSCCATATVEANLFDDLSKKSIFFISDAKVNLTD